MHRLFSLDPRLQAVYDLYPNCKLGADIGSDHGKLPCYLLIKNKCNRMIVSDISPVCIKKAKSLIEKHELKDRVELICADGLKALSAYENVECISITGMGGHCIANMFMQDIEFVSNPRFIISAHTDLIFLRATLYKRKYYIEKELIVKSSGRFYNIMLVKKGERDISDKEVNLGVGLYSDNMKTLKDYYNWKRKVELVKIPQNKFLIKCIEEEIADENT